MLFTNNELLLILQPTVDNNKSGVFGVCLDKVESVNVGEDFFCSVPKWVKLAGKNKFTIHKLHSWKLEL